MPWFGHLCFKPFTLFLILIQHFSFHMELCNSRHSSLRLALLPLLLGLLSFSFFSHTTPHKFGIWNIQGHQSIYGLLGKCVSLSQQHYSLKTLRQSALTTYNNEMQKVKRSSTFTNTHFSTSKNRKLLCTDDLHHIIWVCKSQTFSGTITTKGLKKTYNTLKPYIVKHK